MYCLCLPTECLQSSPGEEIEIQRHRVTFQGIQSLNVQELRWNDALSRGGARLTLEKCSGTHSEISVTGVGQGVEEHQSLPLSEVLVSPSPRTEPRAPASKVESTELSPNSSFFNIPSGIYFCLWCEVWDLALTPSPTANQLFLLHFVYKLSSLPWTKGPPLTCIMVP